MVVFGRGPAARRRGGRRRWANGRVRRCPRRREGWCGGRGGRIRRRRGGWNAQPCIQAQRLVGRYGLIAGPPCCVHVAVRSVWPHILQHKLVAKLGFDGNLILARVGREAVRAVEVRARFVHRPHLRVEDHAHVSPRAVAAVKLAVVGQIFNTSGLG